MLLLQQHTIPWLDHICWIRRRHCKSNHFCTLAGTLLLSALHLLKKSQTCCKAVGEPLEKSVTDSCGISCSNSGSPTCMCPRCVRPDDVLLQRFTSPTALLPHAQLWQANATACCTMCQGRIAHQSVHQSSSNRSRAVALAHAEQHLEAVLHASQASLQQAWAEAR